LYASGRFAGLNSSIHRHHQFIFYNELAQHNTHRKNNSERLPEKAQGSMNWPPITVLNAANNNAKNKK